MDGFTVVRTEHPDCSVCMTQAEHAIVMARVTGSTISAHGDGNEHRATVARNLN